MIADVADDITQTSGKVIEQRTRLFLRHDLALIDTVVLCKGVLAKLNLSLFVRA